MLRTLEMPSGKMFECHILALPSGCCPISKNPVEGSTISISYKPQGRVLDVLTLPAYLRLFRGGLKDTQGIIIVRDMEGMIQRIADDCCEAVGVPVRVQATILLAPKQTLIVRARYYPKKEVAR